MTLDNPARHRCLALVARAQRATAVLAAALAASLCTPRAFALSDVAGTSRGGSRHAGQKHIAVSPWELAEQGRDALETIPEPDRTRAQYLRVMDAYRAVYHSNPADLHAPAAVNAVAELLAEQGRVLRDDKSLKAAVGQYEFLRKQYPGSSLRVQALLTEGEIAQNDLGDSAAARGYYKQLLKDYPKSQQAEEARAGIASLDQEPGQRVGRSAGQRVRPAGQQVSESASQRADNAASQQVSESADDRLSERPISQAAAAVAPTTITTADTELKDVDAQTRPNASESKGARRSGRLALVTGVRHWSTPTYTRVAIDLGDSVTYEAARVPHPDRIYFDLHGTRLTPQLIGKSFNITDDGFLRRVRAAQYSNDVTRIVLDVSDVSEYSAFLLPNPYRLIIDIHGSKKPASQRASESASQQSGAPANRLRETRRTRTMFLRRARHRRFNPLPRGPCRMRSQPGIPMRPTSSPT